MDSKSSYPHYYKKVPSGVEYVDVYRVLEMFNVTDPAIQHALKKLLVAGGRGHKDLIKDVNEAIISLNRWIDMREEETRNSELAEHQLDIFKNDTVKVGIPNSSLISSSCMID